MNVNSYWKIVRKRKKLNGNSPLRTKICNCERCFKDFKVLFHSRFWCQWK